MASPTMKKKSGITAVWGTSDASVTATNQGIVHSVSRKNAAEKDYILDENGYTVGVVFFDQKNEYTVEILCKDSMTNPTVGGVMTIGGDANMLVMDFDLKWSHKGFKMLSVNLTRYTDVLS